MKIKLNNKYIREVEDHVVVALLFAVFILIIALQVAHVGNSNCHVLEPTINCAEKGSISRSNFFGVNSSQYVFIPANISIHHLDEYRAKAPSTLHAECPVGSMICQYHYDTFNGVVSFSNVFNAVAHLTDYISTTCYAPTIVVGQDCFGTPDYLAVILIWGVFWFGTYYSVRYIILRNMHNTKYKKYF